MSTTRTRTRIALVTVSALSLGLGAVATGPAIAENGSLVRNMAAEAEASLGSLGWADIQATEPGDDGASPGGRGYWLTEATAFPEDHANPSSGQTTTLPGVDLIL